MTRALVAALIAATLIAPGCGDAPALPAPAPPPATVAPSHTSHVVIVVMENKEFGDVIGSRDAPFLARFAAAHALAVNDYAIAHPSLPNYLALTGGSTFGITSDCTDCHVAATNLVDQLEAAHLSWKAYMEGLPHACFKGSSATSGAYAQKHNPFIYYDDVARDPRRCAKIVPDGRLAVDLRTDRLPAFAWISPGLCNDTHDCPIATGDAYLSRLLPAVVRGLGPHGLLILTWDEGTSNSGCCGGLASGGRIATVLAGPDVRAGARVPGTFSHYSTLRTVEDLFGLQPLRAAGAPQTRSLAPAFVRQPVLSGARAGG